MAFFLRNPGLLNREYQFPRGRNGVDTRVRVLVTERRYEEIIAICGPAWRTRVAPARCCTTTTTTKAGAHHVVQAPAQACLIPGANFQTLRCTEHPHAQPEGAEMITMAPLMHASIKIPEARFDEVLRIDTIIRSDITLYLYELFSPPDEVVVGEV
ncbi:uncharacterized protein LOC144164078 [Haemaphysalis longicornis]